MSAPATPAAIRAARRVMDTLGEFPDGHRVAVLAGIIDEETGVGEMLAACRWALRTFQGDSGTGESYWETIPGYAELKAAIARAERPTV